MDLVKVLKFLVIIFLVLYLFMKAASFLSLSIIEELLSNSQTMNSCY